jgi:hypothetical protein
VPAESSLGAHFLSTKSTAVAGFSLGLRLRPYRNGEADVGTMGRARRHPQAPAMGFDD